MRTSEGFPIVGYVEELPSGKYRAVAWNAAAKKRQGCGTHVSWEAADAAWRAKEKELDGTYTAAGVDVSRQVRGGGSFAEFVVAFAGTIDGEKSTLRRAVGHARALAARWPEERVDAVTRPMVRAHLAELREQGLSAGTREGRLTLLRHAMASAVEQGFRADDPTAGIKTPAAVRRARPIITDAQLLKVLDKMPAYVMPAVLLAHDSGLRISEVVGLRWHRVDLLHAQVLVADIIDVDGSLREYPKGKETLWVPLTARTVKVLTEHMRKWPPSSPQAFVFTSITDDGKHLSDSTVRDEWNRAQKAAGLDEHIRFHDLRHACATKMARAGVPAPVMRQIMRHADLATTQQYIEDAGRDELGEWQRKALG